MSTKIKNQNIKLFLVQSQMNQINYNGKNLSVKVIRNIKTLNGVFPRTTELKFNDCIVINFTNSSETKQYSSKSVLFISTNLELENMIIYVSFVKYRLPKLDSGKMFDFPDHDHIIWIRR